MINEFLYEGKRATQWELSAHQIQGPSAIVKREKLIQLLVILRISAWPVLFHCSLPSFPSVQGWFVSEIRCQFIILARKDEPTPDFGFPPRKDELTLDFPDGTDCQLRQ